MARPGLVALGRARVVRFEIEKLPRLDVDLAIPQRILCRPGPLAHQGDLAVLCFALSKLNI